MRAPLSSTGLLLVWALAANQGDAAPAVQQDSLPDWVLQLSRAKNHLKENFARIPNYVCQESVERFEKGPNQAQAGKVDSLHFEVARVQNKELLALPGAAGFEDKGLSAFMTSGVMGSGMFSTLPLSLFVSNVARFTPHKRSGGLQSGPSYDYEIPAFLGGLRISSARATGTVGVRGTFWLDAESLDLMRVEEHAVDVPPELGMTEIDTTVEYARIQIGDSSVLQPQSADLVVTSLDGWKRQNKIEYSGCREYTSESTIRFGDPTAAPAAEKGPREGLASHTAVPGWELSGIRTGSFQIFVDHAEKHEGQNSGAIVCVRARCGVPGVLAQSFRADQYRGQRVRLSAWVKTKDAGRARLWMRVDGKVTAFDGSGAGDTGTLDWQHQEIVLSIPPRAMVMSIGLILEEHGEAWLDDVSLEAVDAKAPGKGRIVSGPAGSDTFVTGKQIAAMAAQPVNLNFEQ